VILEKFSGSSGNSSGICFWTVQKRAVTQRRMALNVLDLTADLVDLTGDEELTTTLVRDIDGVDMTIPALLPPPKLQIKVKNNIKKIKAKPIPRFECTVCWVNTQEKKRCTMACKHDLCRPCAWKMLKTLNHNCPICRKLDAVFDGYFEF